MVNRIKRNLPNYRQILFFYLTSGLDRIIYLFTSPQNKIKHDSESNYILFFGDNTRMVRYADLLKQSYGYSIILIAPNRKVIKRFLIDKFDKIYFYRNHWHFRRILYKLPPIYIANCFIRPSKTAEYFLKETKIPLVTFSKDLSVTYYGLKPNQFYLKNDLPSEKYVLNNASGHICESLELAYARRAYRLEVKKPTLFFPIYCRKSNFVFKNINPLPDNPHLVYVGAVYNASADPAHFGAMQFHGLIKWLEEQKIHFHIYPNPSLTTAHYDEYFELEKQYQFFHMHQSVAPDNLIEEIAQYHFGIIPFFNEDTKRSVHKRYYATAMKLFNFFEAQIPVIISKDVVFQAWLAKRFGGAEIVAKQDLKNLKSRFSNLDYIAMINNIISKREKYSIEHQGYRINKFYEKILASYND